MRKRVTIQFSDIELELLHAAMHKIDPHKWYGVRWSLSHKLYKARRNMEYRGVRWFRWYWILAGLVAGFIAGSITILSIILSM